MKQGRLLRRQRVEQVLSNLTDYPLTIVSATMGYGKTTAVREYLKRVKMPSVWVALLGNDGSEELFWRKLTGAVGRLDPKVGRRLERLGFPGDALQVAMVIDLIRELAAGQSVVLVIDDYHLIDSSQAVGNLIELIVQEEIAGLHLVLISRTRPKLNHSNLVAKRLCNYLDANTLAFDLQEIGDYFNLMGVTAPCGELDKVFAYTGGWISAVYLMLLGLEQGAPVSENSTINQLVGENLFNHWDAATRDALLQLSVLDDFSLRQAVTVLENPEVPELIGRLVQQNAFIEYHHPTGRYQLHHVLLDFLREKAVLNRLDLREVCRRAGRWYLDHGEQIAAFDYYHRAGQIEELLERLNSLVNFENSFLGYQMQRQIYVELPPDICVKYPFPFLHIATNFILSGEAETVKQGRAIIATMRAYFETATGLPQNFRNRIMGELDVITIFIVFNHIDQMVKHAGRAWELLGGNVSCVVFRHCEFTFGVPHFLYAYYREPGRLRETVDAIVAHFPPPIYDGAGAGCEYVAQAEYALETGDFVNAKLYADKALYKARAKMQVGLVICAQFTLIRLGVLQGDFSRTREILARAREELVQLFPQMTAQARAIYRTTLDLCEGYLYGCLKLPEMIPVWLRDGDCAAVPMMLQGLAFPGIVRGKAVLLGGNWIELEMLCEDYSRRYGVYHNQLGLLHNAIYLAVAREHLDNREAGREVLLAALREAQLDGVVAPFVEHAEFILPLLYELRGADDLDAAWLERLIELGEGFCDSLKSLAKDTVLLTERETQSLALLAEGLTQREIADQLGISVSAVKRYLESCYQKLDANNKITAVIKGKKLNLI